MRVLIKNAAIVTADGVISDSAVLIHDGVIASIGPEATADRVIDAGGGWLIPGFVDLHCHGGGGYEFMDAEPHEIEKIARFHLSHGTTSMLATTLAASDTETRQALKRLSAYIDSPSSSNIVGIHLEGPHFNPSQCGAQNPEYIRPLHRGELAAMRAEHPAIMRISAAPEIGEGMAIGDEARELGIVASCGHTDAEFAGIEESMSHGYNLMTHLYSGMKGVTRKNSFRVAGAVEAGLYFDDMFVEIIADGCHLPLELLRFIYKIKGAERICLITDAIRAAGMPDGSRTKIGSLSDGLDVVVEDGVAKLPDRQSFAGSAATADRLFKNMIEATYGDIVSVCRMASTTPAGLMGWCDRGEIAVGKRADLVVMNKEYKIQKVILKGVEI